jgi:hypothetical protein
MRASITLNPFLGDLLYHILNVRFCSFGWCDDRENWANRAPFSYQVYNVVAGDSGVTWYPLIGFTCKIVKSCAISGLVKEAFSNVSKFDLLSVKIIVEPGSFDAKADASSSAIDRRLYQMKVVWFAEGRDLDLLF